MGSDREPLNVHERSTSDNDRVSQSSRNNEVWGASTAVRQPWDFRSSANEWRRIFAELLGTFFLVAVAAGAPMVSAQSGGAIGQAAAVTAPGLMVMAIILFMGAVSGAHLNPAVTLGFALRGDFPWRRVPGYVLSQCVGAVLACLVLRGIVGNYAMIGATVPGHDVSDVSAMFMELVLTVGLVSTILGTASGAQNVGLFGALAVGGYIALAGLWSSPISGASMNPVRSLGPDVVRLDFSHFWVYLVGPFAGALLSVGIAYILRGPGGGRTGSTFAQGRLEAVIVERDQP